MTRTSLPGNGSTIGWRRSAQRLWPTVLEPLRSADDVRRLVADDELWDALTAAPLGALLRDTFADDTVRGIVATDALIGTFADLDEPSLVQNVCFLYHLMGGGTGDWDVPVGGMGAVTDALAKAAVGAGAELVTDADVLSVDGDGEVVWRLGDREQRARGHVHAGLAPAVLDELLAASDSAPVSGDEPPPEGAQLKVNLLLTRLPRLKDRTVDPRVAFAGTLHVHEGMAQLQDAHAVVSERPDPAVGAVRGVLPHAVRPQHPRPRPRGLRRADADPLRAALPGPPVPGAFRRAAVGSARGGDAGGAPRTGLGPRRAVGRRPGA